MQLVVATVIKYIGTELAWSLAAEYAISTYTLDAIIYGSAIIGQFAGSAVDRRLFGSSQNAFGPRLSDLSVQTSSEGTIVPIVYGTMRVSGNILWTTGLQEVTSTSGGGGGGSGGGGGGSYTSYAYYTDVAVSLCEGEITGVRRIWADTKLIYDVSETSNLGSLVASSSRAKSIRIYSGTETQEKDPLIQAIEGDDNTPAYRGTAYIVFEDLALADFGNRIPNFTFEVVKNGSANEDYTQKVCTKYDSSPAVYSELYSNSYKSNSLDTYIYQYTENGIIEYLILYDGTRVKTDLLENVLPSFSKNYQWGIPGSTDIKAWVGHGNIRGYLGTPGYNCLTIFSKNYSGMLSCPHVGGPLKYSAVIKNNICYFSKGQDVLFAPLTSFKVASNDPADYNTGISFGNLIPVEYRGFYNKIDNDDNYLYVFTYSSTLGYIINKFNITDPPNYISTFYANIGNATTFWVTKPNKELFISDHLSNTYKLVDEETSYWEYIFKLSDYNTLCTGTNDLIYRSSDSSYPWEMNYYSEKFIIITSGYTNFYQGLIYTILFNYLDTIPEAPTLLSIVTDLLNKSGLTSSQYDLSAISSIMVNGYVINRETTIRTCIENLAVSYGFEVYEQDGKLTVVKNSTNTSKEDININLLGIK